MRQRRKRVPTPDESDLELGIVEIIDPARRDDLYITQNSRLPEYKVGRSHCPNARAKELSKCQNFRMLIIRTFEGKGHLEATIHHRLKTRNVTEGDGREWFDVDLPTLLVIIEGAIAESSLAVPVVRLDV